jgi:Tat protein translocase TatB subunit
MMLGDAAARATERCESRGDPCNRPLRSGKERSTPPPIPPVLRQASRAPSCHNCVKFAFGSRFASRLFCGLGVQYHERMGFSETIFLFFLALLIFGPKKLPEIARQVGKVLNELRRASNEFKSQIESEISNLEREQMQRELPASEKPKNTIAALPSVATSSEQPEQSAMAKVPDA